MRVVCIGAGPGGLFLSILMKKANPQHEITVLDRNPRGSTFGWGVVLSDEALSNLRRADTKVGDQINQTLAHWDDIEVHFKGEIIRSSGHGFCGIARDRLVEIFAQRAEELGAEVKYNVEVEDPDKIQADLRADLIVAADGLFSRTRSHYSQHFKPQISKQRNKFVWLGTKKIFPAFTFIFKESEFGWFQAHCYRFDDNTSTFIVECPEESWSKAGIDQMTREQGIEFCQNLFKDHLDNEPLITKSQYLRGSHVWINFEQVNCGKWYHKNVVLLGDAAASAHFSIGSGTKLCLESAVSLSSALNSCSTLEEAFMRYEAERKIEVLKLQNAARNSLEWFETVALRADLSPQQFSYSLLTRSQRVSHENLRLRDRNYLESFERDFESVATKAPVKKARAPMFVPLKLRELTLSNRVAVSPMATYSANQGLPTDFHLVHLGSRALGGAGLIFTEMCCVSPEARITPGCVGIYTEEQMVAWKRIINFVHTESEAKIALQLGHSGPKGSTKVAWQGMDVPLEAGNWEILAPSAVAYTPKSAVPRPMTSADMEKVRQDFVRAAQFAQQADFDMLEIHAAHGYLFSAFLSPLTNLRSDQYGGSLANRARFPIEVFKSVRDVWPSSKPISVRISAHDWVEGGNTIEEGVEIARLFKQAGADIIDVSSGQVSVKQQPVYGRMWQTPFAERIRAEVKILCMAVGNIFEPDHVNSIIGSGRADLCLLARPHLADPHWTLRSAAELGYKDQWWPKQYDSAKRQLETNFERARAISIQLKAGSLEDKV